MTERLTLIRPDNDQGALLGVDTVGLVGVAVARVVALVVGVHLCEVCRDGR